jgi:SP family arabinose:H+ symporter-like MFS transporter
MSLNTEPIERTELQRRLFMYWVALVAATSGLLFGFDIAVINGAMLGLERQFHLDEFWKGVVASALLFGCAIGAYGGGWLSDRLGRRNTLKLCAVLFAVSSIGAAIPRSLVEFIAARFAGGLAIGVASMLAPIYIAEISPARVRGRMVALNQMTIVSGILLAYLVNWGLSYLGAESWRWMFAVAAIPSAFFLVALFFVPESPRWLIERDRDREALDVLTCVNLPDKAERETAAIRKAVAEESGTFGELLRPGLRRAFWLGIALAVLQQWVGINALYFYGAEIIKTHANQPDTAAIGWNVLLGVVNFLLTIVSLAVIDRLGRRPLLIGSAVCLGLGWIALAGVFQLANPPLALVLACMLFCAGSFAVGLGPVVWVMLAEIYPNRVRGLAMGLATVALWLACTALTFSFPTIAASFGPSATFLIYAAMNAVMVGVVVAFAPETKGHTLEEIEQFWKHGPVKVGALDEV